MFIGSGHIPRFRYLRDFENVELGPLKFKTKSKRIKEEKSESETHKDTIILKSFIVS